jgi:GAF domain-containing protein
MREGGGRLGIAALEGRGVGWAQRWSLSESEGFCARVLKSGQPVTTADPALMSYAGADRPAAIVAAPIRGGGGDALGVLFAGRDHGALPDEDDAAAAAGLAEIGARALETASRYGAARRSAEQTNVLADAAAQAAAGADRPALALVARAALEASGADVVLIRVLDDGTDEVVTRGVHARSAALAAELEGTRVPAVDPALSELLAGRVLPTGGLTDSAVSAPCVERLGPIEAAGLPIAADGRGSGALVVVRGGVPFSEREVESLAPAVATASLLVQLDRARASAERGAHSAREELHRLGEALAAAGDEPRVGRLLARLVADATGAPRAIVYRGSSVDDLTLIAGYGFRRDELAAAPGRALALEALARNEAIVTGGDGVGVALAGSADLPAVLSAPLVYEDAQGGALQLFFPDREPAQVALAQGLGGFAPHAAEALGRAGDTRRGDEQLRRLTALVQIAAQASASSSVEQTLAAVGEHVATLAPGSQAGVFVIEEGRLMLSEPPHAVRSAQGIAVSAMLREDPTAPFLLVADVARDDRLAAIAADLGDAGFRSLLVVPLRFREAVIGALALSARDVGVFSERQVEELRRQSPPIVLAIESALLATHSWRLEQELSAALAAERSARGELDAQDAVVRAASEGWGRPEAAAAVARALAELLETVAAAVLVPRDGAIEIEALHVARDSMDEPMRILLRRAPRTLPADLRADLEAGRSRIVHAGTADAEQLLGPLMQEGASAGFVPLRDGERLAAVLVAISHDPARPIDERRLARAERFAPQAALAVAGPARAPAAGRQRGAR